MSRAEKIRWFASRVFPSAQSATNVGWNLLGGGWTAVLVVIATPVYVSRLGLEGYGIVGLWLVLQVMMGLLDGGMGVTVVREFAGARADPAGHAFRRDLLRTLEILYWAIAAALAVILVASANWIAGRWLHSGMLSSLRLSQALQVMAIALALQFPAALYASGLAGLQKQGSMNALQIVGSTLRYGGGALVLIWRPDVVWFFATQAVAATIQTLATRAVVWQLLQSGLFPPVFRMELLRPIWRYSAGMAISTAGALLMANADRIALSAMSPAAELGRYSIAFTATGLLQLGIQPFYRAYFPRYSELVSAGDEERLRTEYYRSCQLVAVLLVPLGVIGWVFAPQLLFSWFGRDDHTVTMVLRWLLVGITCSGLNWLPAAFQQAHGWTRLHAGMITGSLILGVPIMVWAIRNLGTAGATVIWLLHGLSGLTIELWRMHRRLLPGELGHWYRVVLFQPLALALPLAVLSWWAMPAQMGRWTSLGWVGATGVFTMACALVFGFAGIRKRLG